MKRSTDRFLISPEIQILADEDAQLDRDVRQHISQNPDQKDDHDSGKIDMTKSGESDMPISPEIHILADENDPLDGHIRHQISHDQDQRDDHESGNVNMNQSDESDMQMSINNKDIAESTNQTTEDNASIPEDLIPYKGRLFTNVDEAQNIYNAFANSRGFSVRKFGNKYNSNGDLVYQRYTCSKEGRTRNKKDICQGSNGDSSSRITALRRTGCQARMFVVMSTNGWVVTKFTDNHNHVLQSPNSRHFLRSQRRMTNEKKEMIRHYNKANITLGQQFRIFESMCDGHIGAIGCTYKDFENFRRDEREKFTGHDAEMLLMYLEEMKKRSPTFFYEVQTDEENTLINCFWSDAKSRKGYEYFGDVVVMDATYKTNKYHMILATIAGVNHHGQTIIFGSALLSGETVESYKWLLNIWLTAMPINSHPKMIITDQDAAVRVAVADVLPNTFHRLCIWHIYMKFERKLGVTKYNAYYRDFKSCIKDSETATEFEFRWKHLIEQSGTTNNKWLIKMYMLRDKWVPAYCNGVFAAGMSSSQRAESSHSFMKQFVSEKNSLLDFMARFDMGLNHQRDTERKSDFEDTDQQQRLRTMYSIESKFRNLYTKIVFRKFQTELLNSQPYIRADLIKDDGEEAVYRLVKDEPMERTRNVVYTKLTDFAKCSCSMFTFKGIPCRHILFFYRNRGQSTIPDDYILSRWKKAIASERIWNTKLESTTVMGKGVLDRHIQLLKESHTLVEKACLTEESMNLAIKELRVLTEKVQKLNYSTSSESNTSDATTTSRPTLCLKDPPQVRTKGCGTGGRFKNPMEIYQEKGMRKCGKCKKMATHNSRTCPENDK